jgi:hypothetical protein
MKNTNIFIDVDLTLVDANSKLLDGAREALRASRRKVAIYFCGQPAVRSIAGRSQTFISFQIFSKAFLPSPTSS